MSQINFFSGADAWGKHLINVKYYNYSAEVNWQQVIKTRENPRSKKQFTFREWDSSLNEAHAQNYLESNSNVRINVSV